MSERGPIDGQIVSLLESFLCDAFCHSPDGQHWNWWTDGVLCVQLEQLGVATFLAVGATIWADDLTLTDDQSPFFLAPFELEFYFSSPQDVDFERTIVRFGQLQSNGRIIRQPWGDNAMKVIETRPQADSDWAIAIELTGY